VWFLIIWATFRLVFSRGHELVSLIAISADQILRRDHRLPAIRAHGAISAIMQQDYVAAAHLAHNFLLDNRGGRSIPVISGHIPHHRPQGQFTRDPERRWTSSTKWRTKQIRMLADRVLQSLAAIRQLRTRLRRRFEDEQRM